MTHTFVHACAGSGKTQSIIARCQMDSAATRRLIITLTTSGQDEIESRLRQVSATQDEHSEVSGWYAFLLNQIVRPYLELLFPGRRIAGFLFDCSAARDMIRYKKKSDPARYFSSTGMVYKDSLEDLAVQVMQCANGLVERRLSLIYDEIIIDEVQDISRSGLDVIAKLIQQDSFGCFFVGDGRQSLLDSNLSSNKNKQADRQNLLAWYRNLSMTNQLNIEERTETFRFNQAIADFSDTIFPESFGFSPTQSRMLDRSGHDGVFLVAAEDLDEYIERYNPVILRGSKSSWKNRAELDPINFGVSKGRTYERVAILATGAIKQFCLSGEALKDKSACSFYVGVTRAMYSVAIVVNRTRNKLLGAVNGGLDVWFPQLPTVKISGE